MIPLITRPFTPTLPPLVSPQERTNRPSSTVALVSSTIKPLMRLPGHSPSSLRAIRAKSRIVSRTGQGEKSRDVVFLHRGHGNSPRGLCHHTQGERESLLGRSLTSRRGRPLTLSRSCAPPSQPSAARCSARQLTEPSGGGRPLAVLAAPFAISAATSPSRAAGAAPTHTSAAPIATLGEPAPRFSAFSIKTIGLGVLIRKPGSSSRRRCRSGRGPPGGCAPSPAWCGR